MREERCDCHSAQILVEPIHPFSFPFPLQKANKDIRNCPWEFPAAHTALLITWPGIYGRVWYYIFHLIIRIYAGWCSFSFLIQKIWPLDLQARELYSPSDKSELSGEATRPCISGCDEIPPALTPKCKAPVSDDRRAEITWRSSQKKCLKACYPHWRKM